MSDGIHVGSAALSWDSQILLNMYCNSHMNFNDGTCCTSVEPASIVQLAMLLVFTARSACNYLLCTFEFLALITVFRGLNTHATTPAGNVSLFFKARSCMISTPLLVLPCINLCIHVSKMFPPWLQYSFVHFCHDLCRFSVCQCIVMSHVCISSICYFYRYGFLCLCVCV